MQSLLILSFLLHITCAVVEGDTILLNSHTKVLQLKKWEREKANLHTLNLFYFHKKVVYNEYL